MRDGETSRLAERLAHWLAVQPESRGSIETSVGTLVEVLCPLVVTTLPAARAEELLHKLIRTWFRDCASDADQHFFHVQDVPGLKQ